jgi:hypothetical protein
MIKRKAGLEKGLKVTDYCYFNLNIPGIYRILCNDKMYVGSTTNLSDRMRTNKTKLRLGLHAVSELQKDYNKYGAKIEIEKLYREGITKEELLQKELETCLKYDAFNPEKGYNKVNPTNGQRIGIHLELGPQRKVLAINIHTKEKIELLSIKDFMKDYPSSKHLDNCKVVVSCWRHLMNGTAPPKNRRFQRLGYILIYKEDYDEKFDYVEEYKKHPNCK